MITREKLQETKRNLEQAILQLQMNLAANQGALQMVEEFLADGNESVGQPLKEGIAGVVPGELSQSARG